MAQVSGAICDFEFANGLVTALAGFVTPLRGTQTGHWRPEADLGSPFGVAKGDGSLVYSTSQAPGVSLLVVEREGSAPGNERHILKWYQAVKERKLVRLISNTGVIDIVPDRIVLLQCFARTNVNGDKAWSESDFLKTAGFYSMLGSLVERDLQGHTPHLEIHIDSRSYPVDDWLACGRDFAVSCRQWL